MSTQASPIHKKKRRDLSPNSNSAQVVSMSKQKNASKKKRADVFVDPCFLQFIHSNLTAQDFQKSKIPLATILENFRKNIIYHVYPNVNNYNSYGVFIYNVCLKWGSNVDDLFDSVVQSCNALCGDVRVKEVVHTDQTGEPNAASQAATKSAALSLKQSKKKMRQKILDEDLIPTFPGSLWTEENIDEPSDYEEDLEMTPLCMDYANINQYSTSNECFVYELVPGTKESRKLDLKSKFRTTNPMHYKYVFSSVFDVYSHIDYEDEEEGEEECAEIDHDDGIDEDELNLHETDTDQLQFSDAEQPFQNVIRETSSGLYRVNEKYLEKLAKKYYRKNGLTKLALDHLVFRENIKLAPFVKPSLGLISKENTPFPGFERYFGPDHEEEEDEFDCFELDECDFETSEGANSMVPNSPHPNSYGFLLDQDQFDLDEDNERRPLSPSSDQEPKVNNDDYEEEEEDEEEEERKLKRSGISKSDRRWVQKYEPIVEAAIKEKPYDIKEHSEKILEVLKSDDIDSDPPEQSLVEVAEKVGEKSFEQIALVLLSALNLYNIGDVHIKPLGENASDVKLKFLGHSDSDKKFEHLRKVHNKYEYQSE